MIIAKSFSRFLDFSNIAETLHSIHNIHDHSIRKTQETNEIVILEEALLDVQKNTSFSKNKFGKREARKGAVPRTQISVYFLEPPPSEK